MSDPNHIITYFGLVAFGAARSPRCLEVAFVPHAPASSVEDSSQGVPGVRLELGLHAPSKRVVAASSLSRVPSLEVLTDVEVCNVAENALDQPSQTQNEDSAVLQAQQRSPPERVELPPARRMIEFSG